MTAWTTLPPAYPTHRYATEEHRRIAEEGLIFRAEVGSGVHGVALAGTDDRDELGICVEPPEYVTGLPRTGSRRFDQFERHTAWDRAPTGWKSTSTQPVPPTRSGPGDLDVTIYGLRKFCALAAAGNPSILALFFVPESAVVYRHWLALELMGHASSFVSLRALDRYLGYLRDQRDGMTGQGRVNRPELIEQHGFDVKFAGHAVRLGIQGIELARLQRINLPMLPASRETVLAVRRGEIPQAEVLRMVAELEGELQTLRDRNHWRMKEEPDREAIDRMMHRLYMAAWERGM